LAPETFGLTVVEAFACGKPAIGRVAGGNKELIENSGAGFLYRTDEELEQAVIQLAENTDLRRELGQKAHASYEALYTADIHMDAYLQHVADVHKQKNVVTD